MPALEEDGGRLALRVIPYAFELDSHERLIADDPSVVARLNRINVPLSDVFSGALRGLDVDAPRDEKAEVLGLAAVGFGYGFDALRPFPARLEGESGNLAAIHVDDLNPGFIRGSGLVRGIQTS